MKVLYISKINAYRSTGLRTAYLTGTDNNLRVRNRHSAGVKPAATGRPGANASTFQLS
jgi:hypothetical protein